MSNTGTTKPARKRWRWIAVGTLAVAGAVGGWHGFRPNGLTRAQAQPTGSNQPAATAAANDYDRRVVAYLFETEAVTRDELGEYLIARRGPEKLDALVNRRLIERAAKARNVKVSAAEVENALAQSIEGLNGLAGIGREQFVRKYLKGVRKSLYEWKEDVLRPKLLLTKLCQDRVQVSDEEVRQAFEAKYGERVECRIIIFQPSQKDFAYANYARLRDSEEAFAEMAKKQVASALASTAGKVKPIGRYTLADRKVEDAIFKLHPGEVSELIDGKDGITLVKCDGRIPSETSASLEAKRDELWQGVLERKLQYEIGKFVVETRNNAVVKPVLDKWEDMQKLMEQPGEPGQVLVTIEGQPPVTRQDLGEYLIARYGAAALELLLNRKIIDKECRAKGISISDAELDAAYQAELARAKVDEKHFVKDVLIPNHTNLYEWMEDMLRPKLLMSKLVRTQLKITEEDMRMAFDAKYGERIHGRLIIWMAKEKRFLFAQYPQLRDDEKAFDAAARHQFNPALAAEGGVVRPFARHTTGIPQLEEEAFKLQPGEVSKVIDLPEGCALFKCDKREAAKPGETLDRHRDELMPLVVERKTEAMIPAAFHDLREKASPRPLLKDGSQPEDLAASVKRDLAPPTPPTPPGRPVNLDPTRTFP
jgi:parvulin-like peptidyl-prolyl isomerase